MLLRRSIIALATLALSCAGQGRDETVRSTFVRTDDVLLRVRPALMAGRYAHMTESPIAFYRGSLALYLRDWRDGAMELSRSRFAVDFPMPVGVGDPHVENFGTLLGRDGRLTFEPNDLDGADRVPYLWDLRRLTVGLCVAAHASNPDDLSARSSVVARAQEIARDAAQAYAQALSATEADTLVTEGGGVPMLDDLFRRARRDADARAELADLSSVDHGVRALRRGVLDPDDPASVLSDVPAWARSRSGTREIGVTRVLERQPGHAQQVEHDDEGTCESRRTRDTKQLSREAGHDEAPGETVGGQRTRYAAPRPCCGAWRSRVDTP